MPWSKEPRNSRFVLFTGIRGPSLSGRLWYETTYHVSRKRLTAGRITTRRGFVRRDYVVLPASKRHKWGNWIPPNPTQAAAHFTSSALYAQASLTPVPGIFSSFTRNLRFRALVDSIFEQCHGISALIGQRKFHRKY